MYSNFESPWKDRLAEKKYEPAIQFLDISQMDKQRKSLVEQDEKENPSKTKPKDAKYMSKVDKEVKKETRTLNRGDFKNANSQSITPPVPQQLKPQEQKHQDISRAPEKTQVTKNEMKTFSHGDLVVGQKNKKTPTKARSISDLRNNSMEELQQQAFASVSQTNDYIKDVAIGVETQLNTREFLYYTYFNRIRKKLRQSWEPMVQEKVRSLANRGRDIASNSTAVTRLVITLDAQGTLTRVQVQTTSGLQDLDEAAIEALKSSAPFPNPPKDLIVDGFILINWDFILES
jgi:TonB family protein